MTVGLVHKRDWNLSIHKSVTLKLSLRRRILLGTLKPQQHQNTQTMVLEDIQQQISCHTITADNSPSKGKNIKMEAIW